MALKPPLWRRDALVSRTPILSVALLEYANLGQIWRMWSEQSSLGHNLWSWVAVNLALWLWFNFYRVKTPHEKWAIRMTGASIVINGLVILTVAYFRIRN